MSDATMGKRNLAFVLSLANGNRSLGSVTVLAGSGVVAAGTVLGVVTASEKCVPSPDVEVVGFEGAETATCILAYGVDATDVDVEVAVVERDAEVKVGSLTFDPTVDDETKKTAKLGQLAALGVLAR